MEAVKLSIGQLNNRVRILEEKVGALCASPSPVQKVASIEQPCIIQCTEPIIPKFDPIIEELTRELHQKGKELDKIMEDLRELDEPDDDVVSVCTEAAVEELKKVDGVDVSCDSCSQCIKKKHKTLKLTEKEKKKEMKEKKKLLIEQQKKLVQDEQNNLAIKLRRQRIV